MTTTNQEWRRRGGHARCAGDISGKRHGREGENAADGQTEAFAAAGASEVIRGEAQRSAAPQQTSIPCESLPAPLCAGTRPRGGRYEGLAMGGVRTRDILGNVYSAALRPPVEDAAATCVDGDDGSDGSEWR